MQVYIVQNEKDEICYVGIDPVDVLEEIERMGKTTLTVGIWPLGDMQKLNETYEEIKAKTVTTKWPTCATGAECKDITEYIKKFF